MFVICNDKSFKLKKINKMKRFQNKVSDYMNILIIKITNVNYDE